jgi:hypothetical protein
MVPEASHQHSNQEGDLVVLKQPTQLLLQCAAGKISLYLKFMAGDCHLNREIEVEYQMQNIPLNTSLFTLWFHLPTSFMFSYYPSHAYPQANVHLSQNSNIQVI